MHPTLVAVVGDLPNSPVLTAPPSAYPRLAGPSATNGGAGPRSSTGAAVYLTAEQAARCRAILGIVLPEPRPVSRRALVLLRQALRGMS